jgi:lipopolysaccharide/colanic/teichoic acid biosynthesis glycosyltransferase
MNDLGLLYTLPLFINVLQGRMSIVGSEKLSTSYYPNDYDNSQIIKVRDIYPFISLVKPGVVGLYKVNLEKSSRKKSTHIRVLLLEQWSFWQNLKVLMPLLFEYLRKK